MRRPMLPRRLAYGLSVVVASFMANRAYAEVREIVVGVTPTCPEGFGTCWPGIYHGLGEINDVELVSQTPDVYNCTVEVRLKKPGLPHFVGWLRHFESKGDRQIALRGVEVTIEGQVRKQKDNLVIQLPDIDRPLPLAPLAHKLQWNLRKGRARQPEPDEAAAYDQLVEQFTKSGGDAMHALLIGPLQATKDGNLLEVREFYVIDR